MNPQPSDLESAALPLELLALAMNRQNAGKPCLCPHLALLPAFAPCPKKEARPAGYFRTPCGEALFRFPVNGMTTAEPAILFELQAVRRGPLVLVRLVIALLAFHARQGSLGSHGFPSLRPCGRIQRLAPPLRCTDRGVTLRPSLSSNSRRKRSLKCFTAETPPGGQTVTL